MREDLNRIPAHLALLALIALGGCGGDGATIDVQLVLDGADPLQGVAVLRLTARGPGMDEMAFTDTAQVGQHELRLKNLIPLGLDRVISVEGLDKDTVPIARGESERFAVTSTSPTLVRVHFARCAAQVYRDADGDSYGDPQSRRTACSKPAGGYVDDSTDCDDQDSRAHPGQQAFFDTWSSGTHSWDFDCNGTVTKEWPGTVACASAGPGTCTGEGWDGPTVPECGAGPSSFATCKKGNCNAESAPPRKQACR